MSDDSHPGGVRHSACGWRRPTAGNCRPGSLSPASARSDRSRVIHGSTSADERLAYTLARPRIEEDDRVGEVRRADQAAVRREANRERQGPSPKLSDLALFRHVEDIGRFRRDRPTRAACRRAEVDLDAATRDLTDLLPGPESRNLIRCGLSSVPIAHVWSSRLIATPFAPCLPTRTSWRTRRLWTPKDTFVCLPPRPPASRPAQGERVAHRRSRRAARPRLVRRHPPRRDAVRPGDSARQAVAGRVGEGRTAIGGPRESEQWTADRSRRCPTRSRSRRSSPCRASRRPG